MLQQHPQVRFPAGKEVNFWVNPAERGLDEYRITMAEDDPSLAMGEISVGYVHLSRRRIRAMRDFAPDVRLFINVRHPVDRAWSRARMRIREAGLDIDTMPDAALMEYVFGGSSIPSGDYASVLDRWLSVFPAEQLLITSFDDIAQRPEWVMQRLCAHLGLETIASAIPGAPRRTSAGAPARRLPDGLRTMLGTVYAEPMRRFRDEYSIDFTGPGRA